jgi:fatty acid CoA ligase FadD9
VEEHVQAAQRGPKEAGGRHAELGVTGDDGNVCHQRDLEATAELDANGNRQRAHYDGLPVDFIAEAIATLCAGMENGYQTYHVLNPYDDGIGFDQFVDWLNAAGYPIQRIADYKDWLQRFETAMRALPERQRQHSVLPLLDYYQHPEKPLRGALASTERFHAAVQEAKVGPDKDIPHITAELIVKYITGLQLLGLL